MKVNWFFTRVIAATLPLIVAATMTASPATASPTIDPHVFDSGKKSLIAHTYGQVITKAYGDAHLTIPTLIYTNGKDAERMRVEHPRNFVINIDEVYFYRQFAVYAPMFKLGVDFREFQAKIDPTTQPRDYDSLAIHQAFVAGTLVRYLVEMSGLNIWPGGKDDKVIQTLQKDLARTYKAGGVANEVIIDAYNNGYVVASLSSP